MPYESTVLQPGFYVIVNPWYDVVEAPLIGEVLLMRGEMLRDQRLFALQEMLGSVQQQYPNICCTTFVVARLPGPHPMLDGSRTLQGVFFSFVNGNFSERDINKIRQILSEANTPYAWVSNMFIGQGED